MLRCNAKIWAVVVLICMVAQFITVSLPTISESFAQMDALFEQKVVEEKAKADALRAEKADEWDAGAVKDMSNLFEGDVEKAGAIENVAHSVVESESEESTSADFGGLAVLSFIVVLIFVVLTTVI